MSPQKATSDLWWKNAVVYCLDVQTFYDSDGDGCGDFKGLTSRLDYLAGLGVTCLWLMPFYPSPERDDGYDIVDFFAIDPKLGTLGDFVEFVRTARDRGMRVIVDLVVNHTSVRHPWFQAARRGPDDPHHAFYIWRDEEPEDKGETVFPGEEDSIWSFDEEAGRWYMHRFYSEQPDLAVDNPEVRDEIAQIAAFWLQLGLSGFRIDAVPFLIEGGGPDPHELLRDLRAFLGRREGEVMLLGEVNLPPEEQRTYFGKSGDELHMLFNFTVNQAMFLALARENAQPLREAIVALPPIPPDCQWANFVRNHDELSLDKLSKAEREEVFAKFGPEPQMQLYGRGLRRRLPSMFDGDERRARMVYSLMFSLPGTPTLFYGEEIAMRDNPEIKGRLAVRAPMRWSAERNCGFSTVRAKADLCRPLTKDDPAEVEAQRRDPQSFLNWTERLIRRRKECPEIGWGTPALLDTGSPAVFAHRSDWEGRTLVAVHNLGAKAADVQIELGEEASGLVDLFDHEDRPVEDGRATLRLEPYGHVWYRVTTTGGK